MSMSPPPPKAGPLSGVCMFVSFPKFNSPKSASRVYSYKSIAHAKMLIPPD